MVQFSLRTVLVLVALVAVAIVSLRFATVEWRILSVAIAATSFVAAVVLAALGRGVRRAFAIGFATTMLLYVLVLDAMPWQGMAGVRGRTEFNPDVGTLPTTRLLRPLYHAAADVRWVDIRTGRTVPTPDAAASTSPYLSMGESPSREDFMVIGHAWWAMLLGLCGGAFAQWLHQRRTPLR